MSVNLTSNFFKNARGLTLLDGGGITWSINASTNAITATGSGGGVLSSVGFADTSTTPIYTVTNSPLTANGTIDITLSTQVKNLVFAGPTTGANAQPTFRALVVADLPTGIPNANLQNSSLTVTAGTGLSGGGSVSLGGAVTVSLTTPVAIGNGGTGQTTAAAAYNALSPMTTLGDIEYESGANTAARLAGNTTATKLFLTQTGTGSASAAPAWAALVASDIGALGANPTAKVALATVNGSASTFMRSDGAPALDQTISPTMSGTWTFTTNATTFKEVTIGTPANPAGFLDIGAGSPLIRVQDSGANGAIAELYATNAAVGFTSNWGTTSPTISFKRGGTSGAEFLGLNAAGTAMAFGAGLTNPTYTFNGTGTATFNGAVLSSLATGGVGYVAGAGGTVTQLTSRTTGVTLNKITGAITLFAAAGTTAFTTFTVSNTTVAATDTVVVSVKSGTNVYLAYVTAVAANSFNITFNTTGGTSSDSPVFNFAVIKAAAS